MRIGLPTVVLIATTCCACASQFKDPLASKFVCSSNNQEVGDYNLEMEHFKSDGKSKIEFALKLDDGIIKIYNVNDNKMWVEDSVTFHHEKDGMYYFVSTTPEQLRESGAVELPTKYILNKGSNLLWYMPMKRVIEDGKPHVSCNAAIFHLNCQL
jgi:hypothetical protein